MYEKKVILMHMWVSILLVRKSREGNDIRVIFTVMHFLVKTFHIRFFTRYYQHCSNAGIVCIVFTLYIP